MTVCGTCSRSWSAHADQAFRSHNRKDNICGAAPGEPRKLMKYTIGIDVRVNDVSCLLVDERGAIAAQETQSCDNIVTELGWSEQDPADWWAATATAVRRVIGGKDPADIVAVGLSGQLSGLVALDKNNEVVRNAILLSDERSAAEYNSIVEQEGIDALTARRSRAFVPRFAQSKLMWLKENEPEQFSRIVRFVMPKDYIRYCLTGQIMTDAADAEKAGFFHTEDQQWDSQIIDNIGYDIVVLPPLAPTEAPSGTITERASIDTGLPVGLPVYGATEDAVTESIGMNLVDRGTLGVMLGTAGNVATLTEGVPSTAGGRLQSAVSFDGTKNMVYGIELSCVDSINWIRDAMFGDEDNPQEKCERAAERAAAGAHGVVFLPYLMGERSPHNDPDAKAVFYGLSVLTKAHDLVRAVMEGVAFGLYEIYELIVAHNHSAKCDRIALSGIGCTYAVLKQIVADVFGMQVLVYEGAEEGMAYGAALIAGTGEGMFQSLEAAEALHRVAQVYEPDEATHAHYGECMRVYKELYGDLRKTFGET